MSRVLLDTLCPVNDVGHVMDADTGRCVACELPEVLKAPSFETEQRLRYEQLRTEWLHEQRALERAQ